MPDAPRTPHGAAPATPPLLIAVDGRSGAGKTTLAVELAALLREHHSVSLFHLEDIYPGWDGLDAGIGRYVERVLTPLRAGRTARWNAWDWVRGEDGAERTTAAAEIVLLEGVGAAAAAARDRLDAVIWVEADAAVRRRTAIERDGDAYAPYWQRWAEQEDRWLAADDPGTAADVVVQGHHGPPSPQAVRLALTGLPSCTVLLAPERAGRRGLVLDCERLEAVPDAAALFSTLYRDAPAAAWLDSSDAAAVPKDTGAGPVAAPPTRLLPGGRSRFSIMADAGGAFGQLALHRDGVTDLVAGPVTTRIREPFFRWLDDVWGRRAVRVPDGLACDFGLGWLGYLGYELKRETGGADGPSAAGLPDAALLFAGRAVVLDHADGAVFLLTLSDGRPDADRDAWLARAREAVAAPGPAPTPGPHPGPHFAVRDPRDAYVAKIRQAQAEIAEGNTYEVCLTTSLTARPARGEHLDPLDTYLRLRVTNPAPFAHFLRFPGFAVASTSPERFLRLTTDGHMRAEPIKGTRGRSADPVADAALLHDLRTSAKDRAENIMIVDLLRNDLSHHAVPGSVTVSRLCDIETYATVHQMVSTIDARLRPGSARAGVVASAFPAGSMTGAPKISTMAILDRLEQAPRGPYSGAAGYFSLTGATDLAVVIRTLVLREDDGGTHLTLGVGGAITTDSDPEEEWDEVRTKARGVLSALGTGFPADT
ncbi:aminodeoxychorismate synthase component I [Arthrobacter agilis]|uniref:aminodeoxychorismate synthase component I n=1 Tax=Arthrobacter agilis TaxID=37921 RepID=UPI002786BD33|nr:aminodeoxychorismate synthase component I [Arthrobacter agilis]MDQ0736140.1 para-aminobenzoate synthetase [Arthrobacter agilis]